MKHFLLLLSFLFLGMGSAIAFDFEVDGLCFDVVSIEDNTCRLVGCTREGALDIPPYVTYNGRKLKVVELGSSIYFRDIGDQYNLTITSITVPPTVSKIEHTAFTRLPQPYLGEKGINEFVLSDGDEPLDYPYYTNIHDRHFQIGNGKIGTLYLGRDLRETSPYPDWLGAAAFGAHGVFSNVKIGNLVIGNHVTKINSFCFFCCGITSTITIPESVVEIGDHAFDLNYPKEIVIGSNVRKIGDDAFYKDISKEEVPAAIYCLATTPPEIQDEEHSPFGNAHYLNTKLYVPKDAVQAYKAAVGWKNFWNIEGVEGLSPASMKERTEKEAAMKQNDERIVTILQGSVSYNLFGGLMGNTKIKGEKDKVIKISVDANKRANFDFKSGKTIANVCFTRDFEGQWNNGNHKYTCHYDAANDISLILLHSYYKDQYGAKFEEQLPVLIHEGKVYTIEKKIRQNVICEFFN